MFDLLRSTSAFADHLTWLLNATVCHGPRLVAQPDGRERAVVHNATGERDGRPGIPLTLGRTPPRAYLLLHYGLGPDPEGEHLAVLSSYVALCADAAGREVLFHYDYERGKRDGYPEAHLHVVAHPALWARIGPPKRPFAKAHLPVGGRRFRPTVEDVVEYAIRERLAEGRPGWPDAVREGRAKFHTTQLRAAVRRDPATAWEVLTA